MSCRRYTSYIQVWQKKLKTLEFYHVGVTYPHGHADLSHVKKQKKITSTPRNHVRFILMSIKFTQDARLLFYFHSIVVFMHLSFFIQFIPKVERLNAVHNLI